MASKTRELALECKRQSESCLYTSTSLYIWLRFLRWVRGFFAAVPLLLGSVAGWEVLTASETTGVQHLAAVAAFIAGLLPTIYAALKIDEHVGETAHLAGEFKNLQDRYRQAALVSSRKPFAEFEEDVDMLRERLERARARSITPPEWCFRKTQQKVKSGDYDFDIDLPEENPHS